MGYPIPIQYYARARVGSVDVCQGQDSFFESWNRTNVFDRLTSINAGFMAWGTLEKGILTGRNGCRSLTNDVPAMRHGGHRSIILGILR